MRAALHRPQSRAWLRHWGLLALLLTNTGCAWLDAQQRQIIYRPTPGAPADFAGLRATDERYFLPVQSQSNACATETTAEPTGQIEVWWLPHAHPGAPTLLYLHGTFRNLFQNLHKIDALREAGFAVLAVDYRGWGLSSALIPSERSIVQDANRAWAELTRREPRANQRVIYGHSMGSAVAVDLASRLDGSRDYRALILESAFTSFADVAAEAGLTARVLLGLGRERFASVEKIHRINAPLLMLHGSADATIAPHLGHALFAAAPAPKTWVLMKGGGHSDLAQVDAALYQATLRQFMPQAGITQPAAAAPAAPAP